MNSPRWFFTRSRGKKMSKTMPYSTETRIELNLSLSYLTWISSSNRSKFGSSWDVTSSKSYVSVSARQHCDVTLCLFQPGEVNLNGLKCQRSRSITCKLSLFYLEGYCHFIKYFYIQVVGRLIFATEILIKRLNRAFCFLRTKDHL